MLQFSSLAEASLSVNIFILIRLRTKIFPGKCTINHRVERIAKKIELRCKNWKTSTRAAPFISGKITGAHMNACLWSPVQERVFSSTRGLCVLWFISRARVRRCRNLSTVIRTRSFFLLLPAISSAGDPPFPSFPIGPGHFTGGEMDFPPRRTYKLYR